jgi:hypothetical protein
VQYRTVDLGPALGQLRVVRSGLNPGDQGVPAGLTKVKPGDAVQPIREPAPKVALGATQTTPRA